MPLVSAYKIVCDELGDVCYIGSTKNKLAKRLYYHKITSKDEKNQGIIYIKMRELGADKFQIYLMETRECANFEEQRKFEREVYEKHRDKATLNMRRPYITTEEIKEKDKLHGIQYYQEHADEMKQQKREIYKENKDEIKKRVKEYYNQNYDTKIKAYKKEYREKNKERDKEKRNAYLRMYRLRKKEGMKIDEVKDLAE